MIEHKAKARHCKITFYAIVCVSDDGRCRIGEWGLMELHVFVSSYHFKETERPDFLLREICS
jgi:hypothetical protein